jgi:hypothetical protein
MQKNSKRFVLDCPPQKIRHYLGYFMERKVKYDYAFKLECVELV